MHYDSHGYFNGSAEVDLPNREKGTQKSANIPLTEE